MVATNRTMPAFLVALLLSATGIVGCQGPTDRPEVVWGKRGVRDGDLVKPRAIAIGQDDRIYLVDWTARIQSFDRDGVYQKIQWRTPDYRNGRPSGLSCDFEGNIVVSDSHYHRVRVYSPDGKELQVVGGVAGTEQGQLGYISDCVRDREGNFYLAEFGENQRISKFDKGGNFVKCWGAPGAEPGCFARIRALAIGPDGLLYAADACNHRIQVFTLDGEMKRMFGEAGTAEGQLSYPYDLCFRTSDQGPWLYVVEYGNQRVQKFQLDGTSVGTWGGPGREPGRFSLPWAIAVDSQGVLHVVDSENDRVQRIRW